MSLKYEPASEPQHIYVKKLFSKGRVGCREFFIENLLVRIHFIIEMIWWTGLAPWEFELPFPSSLTSTFLVTEGELCESGVDIRWPRGKNTTIGKADAAT